jgi:ABC-type polysaccharide/polyol phosphate transport system ATPase subunit
MGNSGVVITVRQLTRNFRADEEPRTLFRVLRESVTGGHAAPEHRQALRGLSLDVSHGDRVAIVGNNAAGKSTLLKIIAGLLRPTTGTVEVRGEMVLLTSLGVGMIEELNVSDNTLMYGALYGVDPAKMRTLLGDVLEWAGIPGFEYTKLKHLSTGTRARLAFSVVRHIAADIFLIDEALAAGDLSFQKKTRAFFEEPQHHDRTFLVATHDMAFARTFCTKALWLDRGAAVAFGDSVAVVDQYVQTQIGAGAGTAPA